MSGIADGCPCNSPRGVNHGIIPFFACTCEVCDPEQTGSARQNERFHAYRDYEARERRKEDRRLAIQRSRFLGLVQAYADKPIPSVWDWLRKPAV